MREFERSVDISVVLPVYNEAANLREMDRRLHATLDAGPHRFEIIYVDDGSRDASPQILAELVNARPECTYLIRLRRNFGQSAAMAAGIDLASGKVIVLMDSDLQNDPQDIPALMAKIEEGYDVVSGWRTERKDTLQRRIFTMAANRIISRIVGIYLHDYGCTLKAYRSEVIGEVHLYGEMHRFIPAYAASTGALITEIPVHHHPRTAGKSNYGFGRIIKVSLDLLTVKFLMSYSTRPMYVFGGFGMFLAGLGVAFIVFAIMNRVFNGVNLNRTPLPTLAVVLWALGVQSILMGLITELLARTYHESQNKRPYVIRDILPARGRRSTSSSEVEPFETVDPDNVALYDAPDVVEVQNTAQH